MATVKGSLWNNKIIRWALPIGLTLVTGFFFMRQLRHISFWHSWVQIPLFVYLIGLFFTGIFIWLRGARFAELMETVVPYGRLFGPAASYSMSCRILPGGAGDLFLPVYLRPFGLGTGESLGIALASRLFDLGGAVVLVVLLGAWLLPHGILLSGLGGTLILSTGIVAIIYLLVKVRHQIADFLTRKGNPVHLRLGEEFKKALAVLDTISPLKLLKLTVLTMGLKLSTCLLYFALSLGLAVPISFNNLFFASTLTSLFLALPIQGVAGLGTEEAWWVASLHLVGINFNDAFLLGITFHIMNVLFLVGFGAGPLGARVWTMCTGGAK